MLSCGVSITEISNRLNVSYCTVRTFAQKHNLEQVHPLSLHIDTIISEIKSGKNRQEVADVLGVDKKYLERYLRNSGVKIKKDSPPTPRNLQMLAMHMENYSLEDVGQKFGVTRERVRQIINKLGYKPRAGTPSVFKETLSNSRPHRFTTKEKFWKNVDIKSKDKCWEWQGYRNPENGYARMACRKLGESFGHRLSFILHYGKRPKNHVLHSCDNPPCVNPHHLRDGTPAENVQDRQDRNYDLWYKNMLKGKAETAKFSERQILWIATLRKNGRTFKEIEERTGILSGTIQAILNGKTKIYKKILENV